MKKNMMLRMVASLSLMLLTPCWLCAETPGKPEISARARQIRADVPTNPKEFLPLLKIALEQDINAIDFMERISGTAREDWRKEYAPGGGKYHLYAYYFFYHPPFRTINGMRSAPYHQLVVDENDELWHAVIDIHSMSTSPMTPQMVREILGPPLKVFVRLPYPYLDNASDHFEIVYTYKANKYSVVIFYEAEGIPAKPIKDGEYKYYQEEVFKTRKSLEDYENHKDFPAKTVRIDSSRKQ